ncbi:MAG: hypothetical protein ACO3CS_14480, partial [Alphaproteobacteria bacterium]
MDEYSAALLQAKLRFDDLPLDETVQRRFEQRNGVAGLLPGAMRSLSDDDRAILEIARGLAGSGYIEEAAHNNTI